MRGCSELRHGQQNRYDAQYRSRAFSRWCKLTCTGIQSVHGNPIYFEKASGAHVTDIDGNVLVDLFNHGVRSSTDTASGNHRSVHEKMSMAPFGAPHLGEIELIESEETIPSHG